MFLIFAVIFGVVTAIIASNKGRSAVGWFFVGFLLGLIGLIIVLCVSNLTEENAYRSRQEAENRRLREQLLQERIKAESMRQYTMARLDSHDQALGMDTRNAQALPAGGDTSPYLLAGESAPQANRPQQPAQSVMPQADNWYYERNGETLGPVSAAQLKAMLMSGQLSPTNLVWAPHLPDWQNVNAVPELRGGFPV